MSTVCPLKRNTCCCTSQSLQKASLGFAALPRNTVAATVLSTAITSFSLTCTLLLITLLASVPLKTQALALGVYFERSPESAVAPKGDEVVFECETNLKPDRLEWKFRHSSNRSSDGSKFKYLTRENGYNITNEDRISMLRVFVQPETLGDYQCVAWYGSAAIASLTARLTLVSISIDNANGYSRNGKIFNVAPKNCVVLRCGTVTSNPAAIWSFYRDGEKLAQNDIIPTNGALILNTVTTKDSGNYTCSAMNPITGLEVKLPQRLDLRVEYSDRNPPYFLIPPVSQVTARPGETVVLECPGVGSPPPAAVWSSPNIANINNNNRTRLLAYGLQISDVSVEDQGSYVCRLDNGIAPALVFIIKFTVLEKPTILRGPASSLTNESDALELECSATGNPYPDIFWLINGIDTSNDKEMLHDGRRLVIQHVQKRHAGIVQCFAKNEVGETSEANLLKVNPKQIHGSSTPLGNVPTKVYEHVGGSHKTKGKSKKQPKATMIPPSRPNVTRLSDDSVMLRWYVTKNDGLPIQFFKVQYRMLGDASRTIPRETWQTTNEDIPFKKRDRLTEGFNNFTSSVTGLKPDRFYRFRIIAVYSNNDNKEGNTSAKFFLRRAEDLDLSSSDLPVPELLRIEALTETAVMLQWSLPSHTSDLSQVDGFYAYYRPASSAGEYLKATVDGMHTRKFKIDMLEPGTAYEFKLQSFNEMAASEFSSIVQGNTKKSPTTPAPALTAVLPASKTNAEDNSIYPVVAGAAGGGLLLLIASITVCLCMKKRKNSQTEEENKPQLDHIQADFVTPQVLGVNNHHKNTAHRLNGVLPRMNITPNPLAQEADKNRNVMELRFMTNTNTNSANNTNPNNIGNQHNANNTILATTSTTTVGSSRDNSCHNSSEKLNCGSEQECLSPGRHYATPQRSTSSCETLEAVEGITLANGLDPNSPLSKPLPPLPGKNTTTQLGNHTTSVKANNNSACNKLTSTNNLCNSQAHLATQGIHHAQPYYQTPNTPILIAKRDYQQPPPVPPHQNNNHAVNMSSVNHHYQYQHQHHLPPSGQVTPCLDQQRRTLDRSVRNATNNHNDNTTNLEGLNTRIPSLRRTRRTSGGSTTNSNNGGINSLTTNPNGGLGIPIAVTAGSPRVQRSPMPTRAAMMKQRTRLGSHNDNISSGSLNSIEV